MDNLNQFDAVRFQSVEFSNQGITLLSGQSKIHFLNKKEIRNITLKYGFQSERPAAEVIFGIVIIGLGIYSFIKFLLEILVNNIAYLDNVLSLLLIPVGGYFVINGFRKRLYFEVVLDNDQWKFPLDKNPDIGELKEFIKMAFKLGYTIDSSFLDKTK